MSPKGVFWYCLCESHCRTVPISLTQSCGAGGAPRTQEEGAGAAGDGEIGDESGWSRAATSEGISVCSNAGNSCLANLSLVQVGTRVVGWFWRFMGSSWIQAALPGYVCEGSGKRFNRLE